MPSGRTSFKHNDAARLIRATKAAGCAVKGVTLKDGVVTVLVEEGAAGAERAATDREFEEFVARHETRREGAT
jgi:hypothetical protein